MRPRLRRLALPLAVVALTAGLTACDNEAPDVAIDLVVLDNGDGTMTIEGTAYDLDRPFEPVLVKASVGDDVLATAVADEVREGFMGRRFKGLFCDRGGEPRLLCPVPYEPADVGTAHGFTIVIPTPKKIDTPVCVWTIGLAQHESEEATQHTTKCAKATEAEQLQTGTGTRKPTTTTTTPTSSSTTTAPATTTTSAAPTTTTTTSTTTTTTTIPDLGGPGGPGGPGDGDVGMCPDPFDPMGPMVPC